MEHDQLRNRIRLVARPGMPSTATARAIVNLVHIYFVVKEKPLCPPTSYGIPGGGLFNDIYTAHRAAARTEYVTLKSSPHLKGGGFLSLALS